MKCITDFIVRSVERPSPRHVLLHLQAGAALPPIWPGQFVEVRVDGAPDALLRRPISVHDADAAAGRLSLLVATVGPGTRQLGRLSAGDTLNCVLPLGRGFSLPAAAEAATARPLLVGGGVGVAPLYYYGRCLRQAGVAPTFLLGARTAADLLLLDRFEAVGRVFCTTEDGSAGERGFVTQHTLLGRETFTAVAACGPGPMMRAVAAYARKAQTPCEVSLENRMACGLGACLCCVEKTTAGNVCVCKEGPVFNIDQLLWQI